MLTVRPYLPADHTDVLDVCVRTGNGGADATGIYDEDRLLPMVYADPYLQREPELAFVIDNGDRVLGYILGTADTAGFVDWYGRVWVPHCQTAIGDATTVSTRNLLTAHHNPDRMMHPELSGYPAHLHIDLLPQTQGNGLGRALMEVFLDALRAGGVPAVHLAMSADNERAGHFYRRLGFTEISVGIQTETTFYGRQITA